MHKTKVSLKTDADHIPRKRQERKRYLNVIYFIDSKRTRTLKFSIGTSYLTVGLLSAAVIWSIVASGLLVRDRFVIAEMSRHSKSLLDTVFTYQTRYDEVYEKAYPSPVDSSTQIAEDDAEPASPQLAVKATEIQEKKPKSANLEPVRPVLPIDKAAIAKDKSNIEVKAGEVPIDIDNFASTLLGKNLTIRLSLKNMVSPNRTAGSISGTANFVDSNGQTKVLIGRATRSAGEDEHFNIRYFKNKNLVFEAPKEIGGKFTDVKVIITDDEGLSKEFPFTVNKEVAHSVAAPVAKAQIPKVEKVSPEQEESPSINASEITPPIEYSDAIDTNITSGATETTNDDSN